MVPNLSSTRGPACLVVLAAAFWLTSAAVNAAGEIAIISPRDQETIHDNSGNITVTLRARLGDRQRVRLLLDGAPAGDDTDRMTINLEGIDRGEHTLKALVVDDKGRVHAASPAITFHMWRASSQFPARKPKPKPSPQPPAQPKN